MEIAVPGAVGVLVALCVGLMPGPRRAFGAGGREPAADAARRMLGRIGAAAGRAAPSIPGSALVRVAVEEAMASGRRGFAAGGTRDEAAGALLASCGAAGLAGGVLLGAPAGPVCAAAPVVALLAGRARRTAREAVAVEEEMPEAFGALAVSLGSGHSLTQAMRFVGEHSRDPVRAEFLRVSLAVACGVPASAALDEMLARLKAPALDLVVLALKISKRTGAPLDEMLAEASSMVDGRLALRRQLDVKTSQARMSARMVAAMPLGMVAALSLISGDFRRGLATPGGAAAVALAAALDGAAWMLIRRIMRVEM